MNSLLSGAYIVITRCLWCSKATTEVAVFLHLFNKADIDTGHYQEAIVMVVTSVLSLTGLSVDCKHTLQALILFLLRRVP